MYFRNRVLFLDLHDQLLEIAALLQVFWYLVTYLYKHLPSSLKKYLPLFNPI